MSARHPIGPGLDLITGYLDGKATGTAHQMVMMFARCAPAVDGLSVRTQERVDLSCCGQVLEFPIDRGQSDPMARSAQILVELLCTLESLGVVQSLLDRSSLTRHAALRESLVHSNTRRATIVATPAISAITCTTDLAGSGSL